MTKVNDNQPVINPQMKFAPRKSGVVHVPPVYKYSLYDELKLGEKQYKSIAGSIKRRHMAAIAEKHPNLKSNIYSVIKLGGLVLCGYLGVRYRHSLPLLRGICKTPKKTPPDFKTDMHKIWKSIVKN